MSDRLIGDGPRRPVEIRFHLRPDLAVDIDGGVATVSGSGGPLVAIRCPGGAALLPGQGLGRDAALLLAGLRRLGPGQALVASSDTDALKAGLVTAVEILSAR